MYPAGTYLAKRDVDRSKPGAPTTTLPPEAKAAQHLVERVAATTSPPWSPSSCTQAPTAVSSGCSCFFKTSFLTSTQTLTEDLPVPTQCDAAHNYGYIGNNFNYKIPSGSVERVYQYDVGNLLDGCCARCWGTPGCIVFAKAYGVGQCQLYMNYNAQAEPLNAACPDGEASVSLSPPQPTGDRTRLGPCGYLGT